MNKTKIIASVITVSVGLTAAVAVGVASRGNHFAKANAVNFTNTSITRRVWIVDNKASWWQADDDRRIYINAFQKSNEANNVNDVVATKLISTYSGGLFYADITFTGAGDEIGVIARWGDKNGVYGWGNNNQTGTMTLSAFGTTTYADVINLDDGTWHDSTWNRDSRNATVSSASMMNNEQMVSLLQSYKTCDASYATGYNAYPQFYANFYKDNSSLTTSTVFNDYDYDEYVDAGKNYAGLTQKTSTTIALKVAELQTMYNTYGWTVTE